MPENHDNITPRDEEAAPAKPLKKPFFTRKRTIIIIVLTIIIGLCVWDIADPPVWWRFERQKDKRAIWEYVKDTYPDAVQNKRGKFPLQMPAGPFEDSVMYFKLDDIEFFVSAQFGQVVLDGYSGARAIAQFDKIIQDGFFKPRGINVRVDYWFSDSYDIHPYTGDLGVTIRIFDQGSTPEEIGCLYDFYNYWQSEADFLRDYLVHIDIVENQKTTYRGAFVKESNYTSESEFYADFRREE